MNNNVYLTYGIMMMSAVTVYYVVNNIAISLGIPPLIQTYLGIGVALATSAYFQKYLVRR